MFLKTFFQLIVLNKITRCYIIRVLKPQIPVLNNHYMFRIHLLLALALSNDGCIGSKHLTGFKLNRTCLSTENQLHCKHTRDQVTGVITVCLLSIVTNFLILPFANTVANNSPLPSFKKAADSNLRGQALRILTLSEQNVSLTLILRRSRTGTVWFYTSTSNKRAARPKLYTKSLTRDLKLMYSRFTLVRISINL